MIEQKTEISMHTHNSLAFFHHHCSLARRKGGTIPSPLFWAMMLLRETSLCPFSQYTPPPPRAPAPSPSPWCGLNPVCCSVTQLLGPSPQGWVDRTRHCVCMCVYAGRVTPLQTLLNCSRGAPSLSKLCFPWLSGGTD